MYPTTYHEIISLISAFKRNKADGHDDIPPYFLKIAAGIIAISSAMILNLCMQFGIFTNKLKIAKFSQSINLVQLNMLLTTIL